MLHMILLGSVYSQFRVLPFPGAFRCFLSCYESLTKKKDGKYEEHLKKCRQQGRIKVVNITSMFKIHQNDRCLFMKCLL